MNDPFTLSLYMEKGRKSWGSFIKDEGISQAMYERHWRQCNHLYNGFFPDHYFDNWNMELLEGQKEELSLQKVFLEYLPKMAEEIFMLDGFHIVVKKDKWEYWMHFCRLFSPLVMKVAYLWIKRRNISDIQQFIITNFEFTALPEYEMMNDWKKNLSDIHIHFNNSTEADRKWVEIMDAPRTFINYAKTTNQFSNFKGHSIIKNMDDMSVLALEAGIFIERASESMFNDLKKLSFDTLLAKQAWLLYNYWLFMSGSRKKENFLELHKFLLIQGAFRELFVMQFHQIGIVQFNRVLHQPFVGPQKMDGIAKRLIQQISGTIYQNLHLVELRIGANQLIYIDECCKEVAHIDSGIQVHFICSLIKNDSNSKTLLERHLSDVEKAIKSIRLFTDKIVGVDVAGRDFMAPPATFKHAFCDIRRMRKEEKWHFTYHAGEDFFHVLSGLRTIYEAITFLELKPKDRIGHASAAGVDPDNWARCIHGTVPIKQGEYVDNLLFAYKLIEDRHIEELKSKKTLLKETIEKYAKHIFETSKGIDELLEEWLLGKDDRHVSAKYNKVIIKDCFDIFNAADMVILQKALLAFIADNGIVIEACPTSNISIGYDHSLNSYHLKTWLKWKYVQYLPLPDIVIGTDEVGVFPTNLPNEYACIYEMIREDEELGSLTNKIMNELVDNSSRYAF